MGQGGDISANANFTNILKQLLCQNPFAKKLLTQIVSTEKLRKKLLYEKAAHKILVKVIPSCHRLTV
jgi:hypothetical protein